MPLAADDVFRSLGGTWDLLQRRPAGLHRFDWSGRGLASSFAALALCAPAFVILLAGERARAVPPIPDAGLFDDAGLFLAPLWRIATIWLATPIVAGAFAWLLGIDRRLGGFLIVSNWSSVMACSFLATPSLLLALGLATIGLATLYAIAAAVIVAHLRWFAFKATLGVSGGLAALIVAVDIGVETLLTSLVA